jgi:hypothetical protein
MVVTYHRWLTDEFADRLECLHARGLRLDTPENNRIGHCGNAFTIPVPGDDAMLHADKTPKYWGTRGANAVMLYRPVRDRPPVFRQEHVYLCEGELDALRVAQESYPAVSLTNGCNAFKPEHLPLVEGLSRIYVMYDQDAPGRAAAEKVQQLIGDPGEGRPLAEVCGLRRQGYSMYHECRCGCAAPSGSVTASPVPIERRASKNFEARAPRSVRSREL